MCAQVESSVDHNPVLSVDKALSIVELLLRDDDSLSARDIASRAGLNRTTAHRLLNALMHRGWIEKQPNAATYRLSLKFLALTRLKLDQRDITQEIRLEMERLSALSRETTHLGVLDGFEVVHVDRVNSPERFGISAALGSRAVPHVTALGKALLAAGPDRQVAAYIAHARELPPPFTLEDEDALVTELARTRDRGFGIDNEEDSVGVRCIGVAIRGSDCEPAFAISLTGPSPRFTEERLLECAPAMKLAADNLSRLLGWNPECSGRRGRPPTEDASPDHAAVHHHESDCHSLDSA